MFRPVWRFVRGSWWSGEGRRRRDIAELAGVAPLTVDRCKARYAGRGLAGLVEKRRGGPCTQVPPQARARVIALTRMSPPTESGLSHWSTRMLADHLKRREGISVSWHYVARVWREEVGECTPNRNGASFLAFMKKAVKPYAGKGIHVVLDNLSTHTTPDVEAWLVKNPHVHFHFTPSGPRG